MESTALGMKKKMIKGWSVVTGHSTKVFFFFNKIGYYFNVSSTSDVITQVFENCLYYP